MMKWKKSIVPNHFFELFDNANGADANYAESTVYTKPSLKVICRFEQNSASWLRAKTYLIHLVRQVGNVFIPGSLGLEQDSATSPMVRGKLADVSHEWGPRATRLEMQCRQGERGVEAVGDAATKRAHSGRGYRIFRKDKGSGRQNWRIEWAHLMKHFWHFPCKFICEYRKKLIEQWIIWFPREGDFRHQRGKFMLWVLTKNSSAFLRLGDRGRGGQTIWRWYADRGRGGSTYLEMVCR